jgi:hypothetical protein
MQPLSRISSRASALGLIGLAAASTCALAQGASVVGRWVLSQSIQGVTVEDSLQLDANRQCSYQERQNGALMGSIQGSYNFTSSLYNVDGATRIECAGVSEVGTTRKIGYTVQSVGPSSLNVTDDAGRNFTFRKY